MFRYMYKIISVNKRVGFYTLNVITYVKFLEFQTLLTNAYNSCASSDCGTSGFEMMLMKMGIKLCKNCTGKPVINGQSRDY